MRTVVVTGASGFIGKALTKKLLNDGIEVYAIVRNKEKLIDINSKLLNIIELQANDYFNIGKIINKKVDVFYHLVWDGGMNPVKFRDYKLQLKNAEYSCMALEEAIKLGANKFVLASTINEIEVVSYFNKSNIEPRYTCIYSASKFAANIICKTIAYNSKSININTALIGNSFGIGDESSTLPNILINNLISGKDTDLVDGNFLYDLVNIEDIVIALKIIGEKGINQKDYYIGHRKPKMFKNLVREIRDIINPKAKLNFGVYPDSTSIDYSIIDLDELYNDTGFECITNFEDSILKTVEWHKTLKLQRERERDTLHKS